jgi:hypothetical protein
MKRGEIFRATVHDIHYENLGAVVWDRTRSSDTAREVPWTGGAYSAVRAWLRCRDYLAADHDRPWLNLHAGPTAHQPMTRWSFDKLLGVYVGPEWTYSRLRVTSAVAWAKSGLPLERLREVLGLRRIEDVLPFAQLAVGGTLERDMARVAGPFMNSVDPNGGWSNRPLTPDLLDVAVTRQARVEPSTSGVATTTGEHLPPRGMGPLRA